MKLKILFFFLLFGMASLISATAVTNLSTSIEGTKPLVNLPPPSVLIITTVGTNFVKLAWPGVPGAASYRVITKEVVSGNTVADQIIVSAGAGTQTGSVPLPTPGIAYQSFIWSIDGLGEQGTDGTASDQYDAIIIELVVSGFPAPQGLSPICTLSTQGSDQFGFCNYAWSHTEESYFQITRSTITKYFKLKLTNGVITGLYYVNEGPFTFACDGKVVTISINSKPIIKLTVAQDIGGQQGKLYRPASTDNDGNYVVQRLGTNGGGGGNNPGGGGGGQFGQSADLETEQDITTTILNTFSATPNPFSESLEVSVPFTKENQEVSLSLYDLQGRQVLNQMSSGGDQMITIPTDHLIPGLYFLHVRSGDKVESIRVIKTQ